MEQNEYHSQIEWLDEEIKHTEYLCAETFTDRLGMLKSIRKALAQAVAPQVITHFSHPERYAKPAVHVCDDNCSGSVNARHCQEVCADCGAEMVMVCSGIERMNPCQLVPQDVIEKCCQAMKNMIDRWNTPHWKNIEPTGEFVANLNDALNTLLPYCNEKNK